MPAAPHAYDLAAGVRGLQLAEAGLTSSAEGRRVAIERFERMTHDDRDSCAARKPTAAGGRSSSPNPAPGPNTQRASSSRIAFAAAHVVADPRGENVPGAPAVIDWDATLAFRQHLFRYGLGVAEAMDTAQRNMGLDWAATQELITRSAALAREHGARIASGAGTDQLLGPARDARRGDPGYLEQVEFVEAAGSQVIVMASRQLAAAARSAEDYLQVYSTVLAQATRPVILHWLGEMFDPQLSGYWGSADIPDRDRTFLDLVSEHTAKVDGVKVSLLSADHETAAARGPADGCPALHRRRLQLSRAHRGRRRSSFRCAARRVRRDRAGGSRRPERPG